MKKLVLISLVSNILLSEPPKKLFLNTLTQMLGQNYLDHEHRDKTAQVTMGDLEETKELHKAREDYINNKRLPRITICASGGGYRAMITTLGALQGLDEINLLNSIDSVYSLSGSTWLMNLWIASGYSLKSLEDHLKNRLANNLQLKKIKQTKSISSLPLTKQNSLDLLKTVFNIWHQKVAHQQEINIIDCWGSMIAHNIFTPNLYPDKELLTNQVEKLKTGKYPISICTAITPKSKHEYRWLTVSPTQISLEENNVWYTIPTWAFGRTFKNGKSLDTNDGKSPELPLAYFLGIFGSAFSGTPQEYLKRLNTIMHETDNHLWLTNLVKLFHNLGLENKRVSPAKIANFISGLENETKENLTLIDAGIDCNIPLYPILKSERKSDLIIIIDASAKANSKEALCDMIKKMAPEAQINNIEETEYGSIVLNLDSGEHILYIPLAKTENIQYPVICHLFSTHEIGKGFAQITNFRYSATQFDAVSKTIKTNIIANGPLIKNLIKKLEKQSS